MREQQCAGQTRDRFGMRVALQAATFRAVPLLAGALLLLASAACGEGAAAEEPEEAVPGETSRAMDNGASSEGAGARERVALPEPVLRGETSLEEALAARRSTRSFRDEALPLPLLSQLLWAAQGVNRSDQGYRTAPSAGATFPLELDLVAAGVPDLDDGVWRYIPAEHALALRVSGDRRGAVVDASSSQETLAGGRVLVVISAETARTEGRYGDRAERYVAMEAGHAAQNLLLQAAAAGVGAVVVGAFRDGELSAALALDSGERPLYVIPLGWPAED